MLWGLAAAALTAIVMILIAITGGSDADNALMLLVVGGVILLLVGLAMIAYAVWPGERDDVAYEYEQVSWGEWVENLFGGARAVGPSPISRYDYDPDWKIPGWEPPEDLEPPTRRQPAPEAPTRPMRPPRERRPPEHRQPRPQLSKYD